MCSECLGQGNAGKSEKRRVFTERMSSIGTGGCEVLIREITQEDLEGSLAFFKSLSEEDRTYLRRDVRKREVVARRPSSAWERP